MQCTIRNGTVEDLPFLRAMLFVAAYWRPGIERPSLDEGLATPELAKLLENWGRPDDCSAVAIHDETTPIGAAWYRYWTDADHSYGYVAPDVPELAIGVVQKYRSHGVGGMLLDHLVKNARRKGVIAISLSVEKDNPARQLYERNGFTEVGTIENALTMKLDLLNR